MKGKGKEANELLILSQAVTLEPPERNEQQLPCKTTQQIHRANEKKHMDGDIVLHLSNS